MAKKLLICDLDNTLYDWVGYFVTAFYEMADEVVRITKCDRDRLLEDFRAVHIQNHDSEHPFSLLDTDTIQNFFSGKSRAEIAAHLDPAFYAFNSSRKRHLKLYPSVCEGLNTLKESGIILVAHTESKLYSVVDRLTRLKIEGFFERIYCRERSLSTHPNPDVDVSWLERFPMRKVIELSQHQRKPNRDVVLEICKREGVSPSETAYIGDSIARDIAMARAAGICGIWAKYGTHHGQDQYDKLVRISHWTEEDVKREIELKQAARDIEPDYIIESEFIEIIKILSE